MRDYVGLIVCDTRRARAWRAAFAKAGIDAIVQETIGEEAETGAVKVSVPRRHLVAANELVTRVTRGEVTLPGPGFSLSSAITIVVIVALIVALVIR